MKATSFSLILATLLLAIEEKEVKADVPPLTAKEIWGNALLLFDKIDISSQDQYLTKQELALAVEKRDPEYTDKDAQTIAVLYVCAKFIMAVNKDELASAQSKKYKEVDDYGITKLDLLVLRDHPPLHPTEEEDAFYYMDFLDKRALYLSTDQNYDGYLSIDEIESALKYNVAWKPEEKAAISYLLNILIKNNWYISEDVLRHWIKVRQNVLIRCMDRSSRRIAIHASRSQKDNVVRELYADPEHPVNCINPLAVIQGFIGDCPFGGTVIAATATMRKQIVNMIKDNDNHTYTVTFPGYKQQSFLVLAPTEAHMGIYNSGSEYGIWACVLEDAYAQCRSMQTGKKPGLISTDSAQIETHTDIVIKMLTGNKTTRIYKQSISSTSLQQILARKELVTCTNYRFTEVSQDGFISFHLHGIVKFDPNGNDGGTVTIGNPWNQEGHKGMCTISLNELNTNFNCFDYSSSP